MTRIRNSEKPAESEELNAHRASTLHPAVQQPAKSFATLEALRKCKKVPLVSSIIARAIVSKPLLPESPPTQHTPTKSG